MTFQRTLKKSVTLSGIGLHSGQWVTMTLRPAKPNRGVVFVRKDLEGAPEVTAHFKNVVNTRLATTLGSGRAVVGTVEHLLAALGGLGIDNLVVEVDNAELPILDGSSVPFVDAIESVGIEIQKQPRATLVIRKKVELRIAEKWAYVEPSSRLEVHGSIEFDHPCIGYQEYKYLDDITPLSEISPARTFCMLRDVEALKRAGLARGGSLTNAVVLDETSVLNPEGLRFVDEFARHKVLDAIGDLMLAGIRVQGHIRLHRAGHDLHSLLLAEIFKDASNYEIVGGSQADVAAVAAISALIARQAAAAV